MKKAFLFCLTAISVLLIISCEKKSTTGSLNLSITDAPIDTAGLSGIFISVKELQLHMNDSSWKSVATFDPPAVYNLIELTRGESELLGSFELTGGKYTQLRFLLNAPETGENSPENPGCYLQFDDASTAALFVPSGSESGFKATGEFTVPVNGSVNLTADFDLRKSITRTGVGNTGYILKPVIRLIVENQAGQIRCQVSGVAEGDHIVVFAYEAGSYNDDEAVLSAEDDVLFPSAISSDPADETGTCLFSLLAPGNYDLVVTRVISTNESEVLGIVPGVSVASLKTTTQSIDISAF